MTTCEFCFGTGKTTCGFCFGTGKVTCAGLCRGKGSFLGPDGNLTICTVCGGTGKMRCDACGGTGKMQCPACGGTGDNGSPPPEPEPSNEKPPHVPTSKDPKGKVKLIGSKQWFLIQPQIQVFIDVKEVARLKLTDEIEIEVEPGTHTIYTQVTFFISNTSNTETFSLKSNETQAFKISIGRWTNKLQIEPV